MTTHSHTAGTCAQQSTRRVSFLQMAIQITATARQRHVLRNLDDAALRDIGLTYAQAKTEAKRRTWDVPAFWRA